MSMHDQLEAYCDGSQRVSRAALDERLMYKSMNLADLAARADVHVSTIHRWCSGESAPRPAKIWALADVLGCKPFDLLTKPEHARVASLETALGEANRRIAKLELLAARVREAVRS